MSFSKRINISISPIRLHSASSVQIPFSTRKFNTMLPSIKICPLNILSASSVNLHGITNSNVFHNNLRIRPSPLKSPILRKYTNPFKRCGMYPSISKCNAKRCKCCKHLIAILCNHFTFYIGGSARVVSDFSQTFSVCVLSHKNM